MDRATEIQRMARILCGADGFSPDVPSARTGKARWRDYIVMADRLFAAHWSIVRLPIEIEETIETKIIEAERKI